MHGNSIVRSPRLFTLSINVLRSYLLLNTTTLVLGHQLITVDQELNGMVEFERRQLDNRKRLHKIRILDMRNAPTLLCDYWIPMIKQEITEYGGKATHAYGRESQRKKRDK